MTDSTLTRNLPQPVLAGGARDDTAQRVWRKDRPSRSLGASGRGGVYGFGRLTGGPAAPRPALFVESRYLDFGEHEVAKDFVWRLPIQNTTAEPIEVLALKASCGCTKVAPQAFRVPPGETAEVTLTLDLAPTKEADLAAEFTNFSVELTPQLRLPPAEPLSFRLTGRVFSPYQLEPAYLSFGNDYVAGEPPPKRTVRVRSRRPAEKLAAVCERGTATVAVTPSDDGYLLSITPRAELPAGKHDFAITLSGTAADGKPLPEGRLPAMVQVLSPVAATPAFVPLGLLTLRESTTREVELRARSGRAFEVLAVRTPENAGLSARATEA
ncbi:MAG: DUF1573 domain-containing protein, partial [Pirellulales bacterium]